MLLLTSRPGCGGNDVSRLSLRAGPLTHVHFAMPAAASLVYLPTPHLHVHSALNAMYSYHCRRHLSQLLGPRQQTSPLLVANHHALAVRVRQPWSLNWCSNRLEYWCAHYPYYCTMLACYYHLSMIAMAALVVCCAPPVSHSLARVAACFPRRADQYPYGVCCVFLNPC